MEKNIYKKDKKKLGEKLSQILEKPYIQYYKFRASIFSGIQLTHNQIHITKSNNIKLE